MLEEVPARFEAHAPVSVMARVALERAIEPGWVDEVFETNRQRQYPRELLFSTVVELVSLAALYDKVKRTEPANRGAGTRTARTRQDRHLCDRSG